MYLKAIPLAVRSMTTCLLGSGVRIPVGVWMFLYCIAFVACCVGSGVCDGLITRSEESYRCARVIVCDL